MREVVATSDAAAARQAHPLLGSASRLSALDSRLSFTATQHEPERWISLREAADPAVVRGWLDELHISQNGMRNVAGARVGVSLSCLVIRPLMAVLHLEHRLPLLTPDNVYLRREDGAFAQLAILPSSLYALPADPEADHPDVVVGKDFAHLLAIAAEQLINTLSPVLTTIRAEGRYGLQNLWGGVLDMIGATSLLAARLGRLPQEIAWRRAAQLCDLVSARSQQRAVRYPRPFEVSSPDGDALFTVKGTCCLQYREHGLRVGEQSDSKAYCKTCPFLQEDARLRRCASSIGQDLRVLDSAPIAGA